MLGYILLAHTLYSAWEYNQLGLSYGSDLIAELTVALLLIAWGSFPAGSSKLSVDNFLLHYKSLKPIRIDESLQQLDQLGMGDVYTSRVDFIDIVERRRQYLDS